ncbi:MAG: 30S ribosomal protein S10 [Candidatus Babeliales bacterium]
MAKEKIMRMRMKFASYDPEILENAVKKVALILRGTGAVTAGPFPLPTKKKRFTVLRGPHVDKKSREQFELRQHHRVLDLIDPSAQTMEALRDLSLSPGVDVEIR